MTTKVVFRKWKGKGGTVIALFPQIPGDTMGKMCMSYEHLGQHGSADPSIVELTTPATEKDYAPLLKELKAVGYKDLDIKSKITYTDQVIRQKAAKRRK